MDGTWGITAGCIPANAHCKGREDVPSHRYRLFLSFLSFFFSLFFPYLFFFNLFFPLLLLPPTSSVYLFYSIYLPFIGMFRVRAWYDATRDDEWESATPFLGRTWPLHWSPPFLCLLFSFFSPPFSSFLPSLLFSFSFLIFFFPGYGW